MVSPYTMDDTQPGQLLQKVLRMYMRTNHAMRIAPSQKVSKLLFCLLLNSGVVSAVLAEGSQTHGLVGLRPLPRTEEDWKASHGGSWHSTPTYEAQKGKYPFVAEHIDVVSGWLDGDFKTKRVFF